MNPIGLLQKIRETTSYLRQHAAQFSTPKIGLILGSGLGTVAELIENPTQIPFSNIPHFHATSIEGHPGRLLLGMFQGTPIACLQGRYHLYEGYSIDEVVFPTRVLCALGIKTLILTNAAGGINLRYRSGDLMLIEDHLNLTGTNPLMGKESAQMGPQFPDLTDAYSPECLRILKEAAEAANIACHSGVYAGLTGPTYETKAEVRMLRTLGADTVGMSTVAECIAANHLGVQVAGISCVSNLAAGLSHQKLSHQEVIESSHQASEKLVRILERALPHLA